MWRVSKSAEKVQTLTRRSVGDVAAGLGQHLLHMFEGAFSYDVGHLTVTQAYFSFKYPFIVLQNVFYLSSFHLVFSAINIPIACLISPLAYVCSKRNYSMLDILSTVMHCHLFWRVAITTATVHDRWLDYWLSIGWLQRFGGNYVCFSLHDFPLNHSWSDLQRGNSGRIQQLCYILDLSKPSQLVCVILYWFTLNNILQ